MNKLRLTILLTSIITISLSCSSKSPITRTDKCEQFQFEFQVIPYDSLPQENTNLKYIDSPDRFRDNAGVEMTKYKTAYFYNPVHLSQRAITYLHAFSQTGDSSYAFKGMNYLGQLQKMAYSIDGASLYPYLVDYEVHQNKYWTLNAPWYSGMAQGLALCAQVRAFELFGDSSYFTQAQQTFNSFEFVKGNKDDWFCRYDSLGCFWIEEYPLDSAGMTLNGFIYSIYGLYDYWRIQPNEQTEQILQEAVSTIKNYISLYRCPEGDSFYCLQHSHHHGSNQYHLLHIEQLRFLHRITGDIYFEQMADSLYQDSH